MFQFDLTRTKIFDLGGIIINIDPEKTFAALEKLIPETISRELIQQKLDETWLAYELGKISTAQFRLRIEQKLGIALNEKAFSSIWNALLLDIPEHRIDTLMKWASREEIYLLSNTNAAHIEAINCYLENEFGIEGLDEIFTQCFLSYELGMRKPNAEIYHAAINSIKEPPENCIFFDDTKLNAEAASQMGIQGIWVPSKSNDAFWDYLDSQ
ncbi:MAG: HAD family hydrolase [Luteibaculum sp.]